MDTKRLLSPQLTQAAEALNFPLQAETSDEPKEELSTEQMRERARQASRRLSGLIWHDPRNLDGRTLPKDWTEPISQSGSKGKRTVDASPWIDVDQFEDGRTVQIQLQTWRDQVDHYGEHGGILHFSSAEQYPIPSMWLRVRDADSTSFTNAEEIFRVPGPETVFFRGEHISSDVQRWDQLDGLIADIEAWRSK